MRWLDDMQAVSAAIAQQKLTRDQAIRALLHKIVNDNAGERNEMTADERFTQGRTQHNLKVRPKFILPTLNPNGAANSDDIAPFLYLVPTPGDKE